MPIGGMLVPNVYRTYYHLPRPDLQCSYCGKSFSRPSHLRRHNLIHVPPSRRRAITCEKCGSTFSRRDVLFRHMRVAHGLEYVAPTNQQRSCHRCVRRKIKCDRQLPCSGCTRSRDSEPCQYPTVQEQYDPGFEPGFQISEKSLESLEVTHVDHIPSEPSAQNETLNVAVSLSRGTSGSTASMQNTNVEAVSSLAYHSPDVPSSQSYRRPLLPPITEYPTGNAPSPYNDRTGFPSGPTTNASSSPNEHPDFASQYGDNSPNSGPPIRNDHFGLLPPIVNHPQSTSTSQQPEVLPPISPPAAETTGSKRHHHPDFTLDKAANSMAIRQTYFFNVASPESNRPKNDRPPTQEDQPDLASSPETISSTNQPIDPLLLEPDQPSPMFLEGPRFGEDIVPCSPLNNGFQFDFKFSGLNWLDLDVPDIGIANLFHEGGVSTPAIYPGNTSPNYASSTSAVQQRTSAVQWPFEQSYESSPTRCYLPPLRELLTGSLQTCTSTRTAALDGLVKILSGQRLPRSEDLVDATTLMGADLLKNLLDVYFANFQLIQPIFHSPTWNMYHCPTMLLAAMACLGAVLSDEPNVAELSSAISDVCNSIISWMGASDTANYSDTSYLASLCLHQIYSLGSGNRQLYQNADRTRGVLFASLRGLGLLKSRPSMHEDVDLNSYVPTNQGSVEENWYAWASIERDVRIAWASFEYDCSLSTLTSRRGAVDVSELPSKLPCMDALWEAPSAHAWAALQHRIPPSCLGVSVSSVISAAIAGYPIPENISTWGKRLCGQIIGRLLWDLKQLELVSSTEYFGLSSLSTGQTQSKSSLLGALDRLLGTMTNYTYTADLVSYNISSLLYHYSHLYTADNIMDTVLYMARSVVSRDSGNDQGVDMARQRLVSALRNDLRRTRRLAWHAGQMIAVANEYLVSAPCAIMRLFMSYVFIVAYAQHYPRSGQSLALTTVRLDIPCHDPEQKRAVEDWIQYGGPARVGSAEDILADGSINVIVQDAQAMLQRLRSWGLAEKFAKILQGFGNSSVY